jgi:hypothetical protein
MVGMSNESTSGGSTRDGWRQGVLPGWVLAIGLVVFVVVALALASVGGTGGIVAVAVVEAVAVAVLYSWCVRPTPPSGASQD